MSEKEWNFKENANVASSDVHYDFFDGYIKPEELLDDEEQVQKVKEAKKLINDFLQSAEDKGHIEIM